MGKIAILDNIAFVKSLPRTNAGKILRKSLKPLALGQSAEQLSTIDE